MRWDRDVVTGLHEASQNQVISHRDLDPKNVMWKNDAPYIIDWEAAGYVNPFVLHIRQKCYTIVLVKGGLCHRILEMAYGFSNIVII